MKIISTSQMRELDALTCEIQGIKPVELMERAAAKCFDFIDSKFKGDRFVVFAGMGNNGGDGFVIARRLLAKGYSVFVFVVQYRDHFSASAEINYRRYVDMGGYCHFIGPEIGCESVAEFIDRTTTVIDAIFGIGFKGDPPLWVQKWLVFLNERACTAKAIVSIDVPSGIPGECEIEQECSPLENSFVRCTYLLTFQLPKIQFFFPEYSNSFHELVILDIDLEVEAFLAGCADKNDNIESHCFYNQKPLFNSRLRGVHKGNCGHLLLAAGSFGKMGAAVLAAKAALRSGAGLVTALSPRCGVEILQTAAPDVMVLADSGQNSLSVVPDNLVNYDVLAVGPGIGMEPHTASALSSILQKFCSHDMGNVVIDADAINIIAQHPSFLNGLPVGSIITPHLKELERLIGVPVSASHYLRLQETRKFCMKHLVNVVIKGPNSAIVCSNGDIYFNPSGNQGLATAGSGDVLTGIIAGILSEGTYLPAQSAILGCYIHGLAADIMVEKIGYQSVTATDLIDYLGLAFKRLEVLNRTL